MAFEWNIIGANYIMTKVIIVARFIHINNYPFLLPIKYRFIWCICFRGVDFDIYDCHQIGTKSANSMKDLSFILPLNFQFNYLSFFYEYDDFYQISK